MFTVHVQNDSPNIESVKGEDEYEILQSGVSTAKREASHWAQNIIDPDGRWKIRDRHGITNQPLSWERPCRDGRVVILFRY